ncbi:bacteriorhodopsin [Natrarchaeobaculum sulfurireducens]|uniref:Bacteriorhodopsin n=1 Tax=Natrarchaeobaculum sulfurireducens TaxID=2044521 RepID=A0A346PBG9_9EURY|nr:bacteriorhodopsin [Natrarchaeobaculum sulfurireducens]AXR76864.1 Bacteriorhodopsin [Natrarchaeobaculum sulfurireducens]AXR80530.1 Bacteriorhodopsin [Natrarchaeobaculum sulfurireducens]
MIDGASAITVSYAIATVGLLIGVVISIRLLTDDAVDNDRGGFLWLLVIPAFAGLSYLFMTLEIGVVEVGDNSVYLFRYIDWLVTTPILVAYVGYVAGAPRKWIIAVAVADAMMIAIGFAATLLTGIATWIGFGVSAIFHVSLLAILYLIFPRYVSQYPERYRLFKVLQNHVGLLWLAYPLIWLASPAGVGAVSVVGTAMIIAYIDVVAKTPYVYFVWNERFAFSSEPVDPVETTDATDPGPASPAD